MEKAQKATGLKSKLQNAKTKFISAYYGNPAKDLKIIAVTGSNSKVPVAHFIYEILKAFNQKTELISDHSKKPLTVASFQKSLAKAWRNNVNYVVVEVSAAALARNTFSHLPIYAAILSDFASDQLSHLPAEEYFRQISLLFQQKPEYILLNHDDSYFDNFKQFIPNIAHLSYGRHRNSTTRIIYDKLYKKGSEASLLTNGTNLEVATFLTGEAAISQMAAAVCLASLLDIPADIIVDGIANYEP